MPITAGSLASTVVARTTAGKIIQFPLVRAVIAPAFFLPVMLVHNQFMIHVLEKIPQPWFSYVLDLDSVVSLLLFLFVFGLYTRIVERRRALEISFGGSVRETVLGFVIGGGLVATMVLLLWTISFFSIERYGSVGILIHALFTFGIGALIQELFFRGILFRNMEELLGSWGAIIVVALIFGGVHLGNENATLWSAIALAASDILLTGAYILTRRIWLVWGIHWGWNYFQDGFFGMPNSGITRLNSWLEPAIDGPEWITGGAFGIEASVAAVVLTVAIGILVLKKAVRCGQIVLPSWKKTCSDV